MDTWTYLDRQVAETSPAVVETMKSAGYHPAHTGGGCMTWEKVEGDKRVWICSGDNGLDAEPGATDWLVGIYGPDGEFLNSHEAYTIADALVLAARLPRDMSAWDRWVADNPNWYQG